MFDYLIKDTICALATAPYKSAIAVVRVSGPSSFKIKMAIFQGRNNNKNKYFVSILGNVLCSRTNEVIDEALCTCFPINKSYTGEDSFELSIHGSLNIIENVIDSIINAGARLALPGEFTLRSVLTGRLNLCEAEAIEDIINSSSLLSTKIALKNLNGAIKKLFLPIRKDLINILSVLECQIDFPEESFIEINNNILINNLTSILMLLKKILKHSVLYKNLCNGTRILLYGKPNVGKSTLFNSLLNENRAIVHESKGTTRDVLEADFNINGYPIKIIDVAGYRSDKNLSAVEKIGIKKANIEVMKADIIILLDEPQDYNVCVNNKINSNINNFEQKISGIILKVINKSDLCNFQYKFYNNKLYFISAKTSDGIKELKEYIYKILNSKIKLSSEALLTKVRQVNEVKDSYQFLNQALLELKKMNYNEIIIEELRQAISCIDRLLGKQFTEDVLNQIFSNFCIGK